MEHELRALVLELQEAWNHGDAARFAAPFAEDAEFIHILGGRGVGRATIRSGYEGLFRTLYARSHTEYRVESVKPLGEAAALVLMHQKLMFFSDRRAQEIYCRPTLVAVRRDGGWQIAFFQSTKIAGQGSAEADAVIEPPRFDLDPGAREARA